MPRSNPSQPSTNPSSSSATKPDQTSRSSRNLDLAAYARPNQEETMYQLLTVPFTPDPCLYPPPMSMADRCHNYSSFLPVAPPPSHPPSTSIIPRGCFEEFITHTRPKKIDHFIWGGPIDFSPIELPNNRNKNVFGTPLRDCLAGFGVRDPDQRLFESWAATGKTHIDFKIMWPSYPQLDWIVPISIYGSDSLLVTKREFAHRIAVQYENFVLMCENNQLVCHDPRWRIGPGGYTLDRMRLSTLHWMEKDIWQAYVSVLTDRDVDPKGLKPMRDLSQG